MAEADEQPLSGVKVLDLTSHVAGPWCAQLLRLYGAEVTKIERPGGDPTRLLAPFVEEDGTRESLLYLYLNHGKQCRTLDLKDPAGRDEALQLARDADVVVESFRPGVIDRLGLGWDVLHALNPRLVLTSISSFGQEGPYRDYKASDIVADAMGGLAYIHGSPDREPLSHGNPQASYRAGVVAASATVAALLNLDGEGEHVDVSVTEVVASALREMVPLYTFMGGIRLRSGSVGGGQGRITPCKDGYVIPTMYGSADWASFARFMDAPELADERFETGDGRQRHSQELATLLRKRLESWSMVEYFEGAQTWGMGAGMVMSPDKVLECEQHAERAFFQDIETPAGRRLSAPRGPFAL